MNLEGKIALVTGGSRGIGRAVCLRLAELGATVAVSYVSNEGAAAAVVEEIGNTGGTAMAVRFDIADGAAVQEGVKMIIDAYGRIDILVNNAGITRDGLFARMKQDAWDAVINTNLTGAMHCMKAVMRPMMKQRAGRIISITSVIGFAGNAGQANYAAAKAGLVGLSKSLAREVASRGITVNCVAPGYIETDMTSVLDEEVKKNILATIPAGRFGEAADVAEAVAFLASDGAGYITGSCIHVNGGMYMA